MADKTKKCIFCAETIKAEAVVCRYCGRDLVGSEKQPLTANSINKSRRSKWLWIVFAVFMIWCIGFSCSLIAFESLMESGVANQGAAQPSLVARNSPDNSEQTPINREITPEPSVAIIDTPTIVPTILPTVSPTNTLLPTPEPTSSHIASGVINANANLRSGPGTNYEVVGSVLAGTTVFVHAMTESGWYQIDIEEEIWIGSSLVNLEEIEGDIVSNATPVVPTLTLPPRTYQWVNVEDVSYGVVKRFGVKVTTSYPILKREARAICSEVLAEFKTQQAFNAVIIYIYEEGTDIDWVFNIAACHYAPGGKWEDADLVQTGDYSTHQFSYRYADRVNR